jgi:hypothetical protein
MQFSHLTKADITPLLVHYCDLAIVARSEDQDEVDE